MVDVPQIDIEKAVRQFVSDATGLPLNRVIRGNQSAPSPNGAYATILTLSIDQNGLDWNTNTEVDNGGNPIEQLNNTTKGNREASFSIQFYRQDVFEYARQVLQYAKTPNGEFLLQQNGLSWRRESAITQVDQVDQGNKWEKRAAITLNFGFIETTTQTINALTSAEITVEHSGETDIQEVINVTSS